MKSLLSPLVWAVVLYTCGLVAQEPVDNAGTTLTATGLVQAPTLDGKLDDICWKNVPWTASFQPFKGKKNVASPGRAKLAFDFHALYIAFETKDPDIVAKKRDHDGPMWEDDDVEIFIDAAGRADHYIEVGCNALNCAYDYLIFRRDSPVGNGRYIDFSIINLQTAAARLEGGGWSAEFAIPWVSLPSNEYAPPRSGDKWKLNIIQVDKLSDGKVQAATLAPLEGTHDPKNFLPVLFDSSAIDAQLLADKALADKLLQAQSSQQNWWLGEHLDDCQVLSSIQGALPRKPEGFLAKTGFGRVIKRPAPKQPYDYPEPSAPLVVHACDSEIPDLYDLTTITLPKLKTQKLRVWFRMDPTKAKALASGAADGVGVNVEVGEPAATPTTWRRIASLHAFDVRWAVREVAVPSEAPLRIVIDRGPATPGYDMGEMALEALIE